jgi:hypothetical protein
MAATIEGAALEEGNHEWRPPYQMGSCSKQRIPLSQRLRYQKELQLFEIPKPAVYETGRFARGSGREVMLLDEGSPQTTGYGFQQDTCPGNSSTDHHHVEAFLGKSLERGGSPSGG